MNMAKRTLSSRLAALSLASIVGFTTLTASAPNAHADEVSPTGKGITGGGLLGGEVVTITEALAGVRPGWAYLLGGGLGVAGGAVGGYFVEQASDGNGQGPVYMLAGGLALVIPALVLSLNATRYRPDDSATEDHPPAGPPADPGTAGGSVIGPVVPVAPAPAKPPAPTSLFDIRAVGQPTDGFRVGVPLPEVRSMYSIREQAELGLPQRTELKMPLLAVTF
jgi:hypothetical protein